MAKLDAELEMLLARKEDFDRNPWTARLEMGPDELIRVSIVFSGDIQELEKAGLQVGSAGSGLAYGTTTLAGLQALAALPQVQSIQRRRQPHLHLNESVPDIKANQVWGRSGDSFNGYTGRGVIVGIIDTGIDITHNNFRKADGTTRIVALWDQTLQVQGGESAPGPITNPNIALNHQGPQAVPLGYGVEYDPTQINDTLQNANPVLKVRHVDTYGHGTHVAGIAAGNGSKASGCHGTYTYIGVAPEADIIVVRQYLLTPSDKNVKAPQAGNVMLDAIRYILNQASTRNQPAVINLSQGTFTQFMDGTSDECLDVDALLKANSQGRAIVFSAGNEGASNFHASALVPPGPAASLALNFTVKDDPANASHTLMVMYSGSNIEVQLTSPVAGAGGVISWVSSGAKGTSSTANGPNNRVDITNDANLITIQIVCTQVPNTTPAKYYPYVAGTWKLELRDTDNTPTNIDAYSLYGDSKDSTTPRFLSNTTSRSTLSELATCYEALAVGSCKVGGDLSDFSSRGPTLDAQKRTKPELCAPGDNVTSAHSSASASDPSNPCADCCCSCCGAYIDKGGTSMAAPHVAGVIALMLHKDPNLTHVQITAALTGNVTPKPSGTSPDDDLGWGAGRTDAKATVDSAAVVAVNAPVAMQVASPLVVPEIMPQVDAIETAREALLATERGAEFSQLFERHATEVQALINTNRRVATVWHRCKGPVWVRLSLRAVHSPGLPVPTQVADLTLHEALHRFARVVRRYASTALRHDLQIYLPQLSVLAEGMSLSDLIHAIGRRRTTNTDAYELHAVA
jgi:subtilisin family serine protease